MEITTTEVIKSSITIRKKRKLQAEIIISNLENRMDELDKEDQKNLRVLKGLVITEKVLIDRELFCLETIKKNEEIISLSQKLNKNLLRLNEVTAAKTYDDLSNYMENCMTNLALKHKL